MVIWDFDGPVGQLNATFPYNFNSIAFDKELGNVRYLIDYLKPLGIKNTFAITGFSAEKGPLPMMFPDLIHELAKSGHEIASHTWRHEWIPLHSEKQVFLSLQRSKKSLEEAIEKMQTVCGLVPPFNRPMTWLAAGNFSFGDIGFWPFFKMADNGNLFKVAKKAGYRWIRISNKSLLTRLKIKPRPLTGKVRMVNQMLVLENHYNGFDQKVIDYIEKSDSSTFTVSAHPIMLSFENKIESKQNFENFIQHFASQKDTYEFITPSQLLEDPTF